MITQLTGAEMIAVERDRQKSKEGWDKNHDACHNKFEMTKTAICYAASAANIEVFQKVQYGNGTMYKDPWPFDCCQDKRNKHELLKKLAIAGALIAAEIDRLKDI